MTAAFFGSADKQLLGVHHSPTGADRRAGVVLCYPGMQEYMHTHWAFRMLAASLAREGFHVFRFDYFGTGDSAGSAVDGSVAQWTEDVQSAVRELQDISGVKKVSLVGMRLGAFFAASAAQKVPVEALILWEPVVRGRDYLSELWTVQRLRYAESLYPPKREDPEELLGFPFPAQLSSQIEALDLTALAPWPSAKTHVVVSKLAPPFEPLKTVGTLHHVAEEAEGKRGPLEGALLSQRVLQAIAGLLCGRAVA